MSKVFLQNSFDGLSYKIIPTKEGFNIKMTAFDSTVESVIKNLKKGISRLVNYETNETLEKIQKKLRNKIEKFSKLNMVD